MLIALAPVLQVKDTGKNKGKGKCVKLPCFAVCINVIASKQDLYEFGPTEFNLVYFTQLFNKLNYFPGLSNYIIIHHFAELSLG